MNHKRYIIAVLLIITVIGTVMAAKAAKPFSALCAADVKAASVSLLPPGALLEMDDKEIQELVEILQTAVIYKKDNSYEEYDGQAVIFELEMADGDKRSIQAYSPFLIIDGQGYRTKSGPCGKLNALGNSVYRNHYGTSAY